MEKTAAEARAHDERHIVEKSAFTFLNGVHFGHETSVLLDVEEVEPLEVAEHIGEHKAAKLLKALAEGKSGDDVEGSDDDDDSD